MATEIVKTPTQRQLNNNSTKVGLDTKISLHPTALKLNVHNISAVSDCMEILGNYRDNLYSETNQWV